MLASAQEEFANSKAKIGPSTYNPSYNLLHKRTQGPDMSKGLGRKLPPKKSKIPEYKLGPGDYDTIDALPNSF